MSLSGRKQAGSVVSTDGKENNLMAWNCITANLRPDTKTQPWVCGRPRGPPRARVHFHTVSLKYWKPHEELVAGPHEPQRKVNSVNVVRKTNSKTIKSVTADSFSWSVCVLCDRYDREGFFFLLFTGFVWNSVIGTRTLEWDAPQREEIGVKWRKCFLFHLWSCL